MTDTTLATCPKTAPREWPASLTLALRRDGERTVLARNRHQGPLRVQRPFHPEGPGCCHLYLLHPPGGLVSGDRIDIDLDAGHGSHGVVTTPSSGKVYRAAPTGEAQTQATRLSIADGARLEWLPQDTIVFDNARGVMSLDIDIQGSGRFLGWEMVCLGRAAGQHPFRSGSLTQRLSIRRNGRPWLIERTPIHADSSAISAPWGLDGKPALATLAGTLTHLNDSEQRELLAEVREQLGGWSAGATVTRDLLLVRLLHSDAEALRHVLQRLWQHLRPALMNCAPSLPRIWAT
ncbi:urease accessory protein UreD [Mangrovitalea sediminis]|uniref:urease accessory protein UreD n=1 Tax=Mangrovitalea sediminis TaxID=1982043 RepID=UPI001304633C|nr:urease accessory protein UreD [Mangrovitalea sediminis]